MELEGGKIGVGKWRSVWEDDQQDGGSSSRTDIVVDLGQTNGYGWVGIRRPRHMARLGFGRNLTLTNFYFKIFYYN